MILDRALQLKILTYLNELYPQYPSQQSWDTFVAKCGDRDNLAAHMLYLEEHGLIQSGVMQFGSEFDIRLREVRITAVGIDFLADDGGIRAILNTVIIKVHDDTLTRLEDFLARNAPNLPQFSEMSDRLRALPADAIKHVLLKLLDLALEHAPQAALQLLKNALV